MRYRPHFVTFRRTVRVGLLVGALTGCAPQVAHDSAPVIAQIGLDPTAIATPTRYPTPTPLPTITPEPTPPAENTISPTSAEPTPLSADLRRQVFDKVWTLVDQKYLYPDFNGVDWKRVYDDYLPKIDQADSNDTFYADLSEMIELLDDHHSRFLPPAAAQIQDTSNTGLETTVGVGIMASFERDSGYISTVFPDSPAALADIRPRDRIVAVDGHPYTQDDGDIQGPAGSTVRLTIQRPGEKPRDVVVVRQEVQGRITPTYKRMHGDIGYLSIPTLWVEDMDSQVSGAITELVAAGPMSGVIVDLRGNGGGWEHVLSGILGHFVRGPVGTFYDQRSSRVLNVTSSAGPDVRRIPLIILVDNDTQSYAEVLAAVLQESGAKVVGTPSAGNTESIYVYSLRDGSRLWLAQENFKLRSGANIEGRGVQPDSLVDVDWKRYSEDDDPQILEALRLLGAGPK